jgi:hypothetical protein
LIFKIVNVLAQIAVKSSIEKIFFLLEKALKAPFLKKKSFMIESE